MHENGVATTPAGSSRWRPTALLLLCLTSVGVTAHDWSFLIGDVRRDTRVNMHRVVTELRAEQPHRYRLLTPVLLDIPVKFFARYMPYDDAFGRVYAAFYFLSFTLTIYALFAYLRLFFAESEALVGALMAAATMDVGLRGYDWSPHSHIEPALLCFGLILIYRERHAWLALLILVASLNRETGVFLPLLFFLVKPLTMQRLKVGAGLMAMWAVPIVALRWWLAAPVHRQRSIWGRSGTATRIRGNRSPTASCTSVSFTACSGFWR